MLIGEKVQIRFPDGFAWVGQAETFSLGTIDPNETAIDIFKVDTVGCGFEQRGEQIAIVFKLRLCSAGCVRPFDSCL
jgi:hypothetical protein